MQPHPRPKINANKFGPILVGTLNRSQSNIHASMRDAISLSKAKKNEVQSKPENGQKLAGLLSPLR